VALTIPKPVRPGLLKLSQLDDAAAEQVTSLLGKLPHTISLAGFEGRKDFQIPGVSEKESQQLLRAIYSVASFWATDLEMPLPEFASDVAEALASGDEHQAKLAGENVEAFKSRLIRILEPEAVEATAKAFGLIEPLRLVLDLEREFQRLYQTWRAETRFTSSATEKAMHPAYQRIIGMGQPAVPFVLRELERAPDHWFWVLTAITGENPVNPNDQGDVQAMAASWIDWGRRNALL